MPELGIPEEWNHAEWKDLRLTTDGPPGYEQYGSLPEQDGRRIGERDLVTFGLSIASLAPLHKPTTGSTKQGLKIHLYKCYG